MVIEARYQKLFNDLFWKIHCPTCYENGCKFTWIEWVGYNDQNWWINVAPKRQEQKCPVCGTTFKINFNTVEVEVINCKEEGPDEEIYSPSYQQDRFQHEKEEDENGY